MDPEILKRIDALAEKVGATGTHLWERLVHREVCASVAWGIFFLLLVVGCLWEAKRCLVAYDKASIRSSGFRGDDGQGYLLGAIVLVLVAAFSAPGIVANAIDAMNPEAAVVKTILK